MDGKEHVVYIHGSSLITDDFKNTKIYPILTRILEKKLEHTRYYFTYANNQLIDDVH